MKPSPLTLFFLLFAFPIAFSNDAQPVVDIYGDPVLPGGKYHIMPPFWGGAGGGVRLGKTGNSKCPVTVLQDYSDLVSGISVNFSIPGVSTGGEIYTGTPLEIAFTEKPKCAQSSKWEVFIDSGIQKSYVGIGEHQDHPGEQTLYGIFNIQNHLNGYKFVFCAIGLPSCFDIGRFDNRADGGRRLVLTNNDPFNIVFIESSSYSGIRSVV